MRSRRTCTTRQRAWSTTCPCSSTHGCRPVQAGGTCPPPETLLASARPPARSVQAVRPQSARRRPPHCSPLPLPLPPPPAGHTTSATDRLPSRHPPNQSGPCPLNPGRSQRPSQRSQCRRGSRNRSSLAASRRIALKSRGLQPRPRAQRQEVGRQRHSHCHTPRCFLYRARACAMDACGLLRPRIGRLMAAASACDRLRAL
mmetsp:Transcript_19199/g.44922  ORF Transcript_19199/g.44922 Transcript_19199/m.44922 type:complete len:201 (-) Transcript_19199:772-1374(-)